MKYLIIVDMQNDFVTGPLGTLEAVAIVDKIKEKIEKIEKDPSVKIIFTRDTHYRNYLHTLEGLRLPIEHCIFETPGWCVVDSLREATYKTYSSKYINKYTFGNLNWEQEIHDNGTVEIEIVGVCTDICVISNALILKATYPEILITVDASCCAGTTPEMHQKALDVMRSCQIEIVNENI